MALIEFLPVEIVQHIAYMLDRVAYMSRLSRTSKKLYSILNGYLYLYDATLRHGKGSSNRGESAALCWAAQSGEPEVVDKALVGGADINSFDESYSTVMGNRVTPLHIAMMVDDLVMVEHILAKGANVHKAHPKWYSAIGLLLEQISPDLFKLIFEADSFEKDSLSPKDQLLLELAVKRNNIPLVQYLLQTIDTPGVHNYDTNGLLHIAAYQGYLEMAWLLLQEPRVDSGPLLTIPDSIASDVRLGQTAFSVACGRGRLQIVQLLLEHGVDVNTPCRNGLSAIQYAMKMYQVDVVLHLLAEASGSVDYDSNSVLKWAKGLGDKNIAKVCMGLMEANRE